MASRYGEGYGYEVIDEENVAKYVRYLFVNRVIPTIEIDSRILHRLKPSYNEYSNGEPETIILMNGGESILKDSPTDAYDSGNNKILKEIFKREDEKI